MNARLWLAAPVLAWVVAFAPRFEPRRPSRPAPAAAAGPGHVHARRPDRAVADGLQLGPRAGARRAATSSCRAAPSICASWTSPPPSTRRPCISARSPSRRASACSSRTTSTTCSSPRSCCASTSAATSHWCARPGRRHDARGGGHGAASQLQQRARLADRHEIVTGLQADHIRFPELPGNLYSRPTLIWSLENGGAARHRVEASYLASKLAWNADYVLTVARDDKTADLDGWVTLTNGSGTAFRNAKLQLVAGELNRVRQVDRPDGSRHAMAAAAPAASADGAGVVLRLPPLHARPEDDDQQQRDQAGQHARGDRLPGAASATSSTDRRSTTATRSIPGSPIKDVVQVYYQFKNEAARPRHADAGGHRPRLPGGLEGRHRSSSARTASTTRRRTRPST